MHQTIPGEQIFFDRSAVDEPVLKNSRKTTFYYVVFPFGTLTCTCSCQRIPFSKNIISFLPLC